MSYMSTKFCKVCDEDYDWAAPECPGCVHRRGMAKVMAERDALADDNLKTHVQLRAAQAEVDDLRNQVEKLRRDRDSYANSNFEGQLSTAYADIERLSFEVSKAEKLRTMALRWAEQERAEVVAWLRDESRRRADDRPFNEAADSILRGEHRKDAP